MARRTQTNIGFDQLERRDAAATFISPVGAAVVIVPANQITPPPAQGTTIGGSATVLNAPLSAGQLLNPEAGGLAPVPPTLYPANLSPTTPVSPSIDPSSILVESGHSMSVGTDLPPAINTIPNSTP